MHYRYGLEENLKFNIFYHILLLIIAHKICLYNIIYLN